MAMTRRGLIFLLAGLVLMVLGYLLMCGGASGDPAVFSDKIFSFRRIVLAPLVILGGIAVEVLAIMGVFKEKEK